MRNISRIITLALALLLAAAVGFGTFYLSKVVLSSEDIVLDSVKLDQTSFIYVTDPKTGKQIEYDRIYDEENRIWVEYDKIPEDMVNAFVSIEDERFYKHHGFDVKRLMGAASAFVSESDSAYGASTITQQLVKNISGDNERSIERKIQEIYRAVRVEQKYSKEEILEFYLNTIFLGHQCNGIQAAANRYFDKDVWDLDLAETASIAGITQFPTKYDPILNPENNKKKQELVLKKMYELGYIDKSSYDKAVKEKLVFCKEDKTRELKKTQTEFSDAVINEVLEDLQTDLGYPKQIALKMLYAGGLKINASVDLEIQDTINEVYSNPENFPGGTGDNMLQSAMVVIDPETGYIVGMSGGRPKADEGHDRMQLNRATQSLRQPGSSIKPIAVYGPALEYGIIEPTSTVVDEPLTIGKWTPKNANNKFSGSISIMNAVTWSRNIPAIKVLQSLGVDNSFDFLTNRLGVTSLVEERKVGDTVLSDKGLASLALGGLTDGISPLQMAGAYSAFANGGIYHKPTTYIDVRDSEGNIILKGADEGKRVMMPDTAWKMTTMLRSVVQSGTGTGAYLSSVPAAGKTGTTDSDKDRWFVGYTPYYVGAVWCGYDIPRPMYGIGSNPSVAIWRKVMSKVHEGKDRKDFEKPEDNDNVVKICKVSGKRATDLCALDIRGSQVEYVDFKGKKPPEEKCTDHKEYFLCYSTGLRARSGCPRRRVSALGVADATHGFKDGYITAEYCAQYHAQWHEGEESYTICLDSGLLAGPNCKRTRTVTGDGHNKPSQTCSLEHPEAEKPQNGENTAQNQNNNNEGGTQAQTAPPGNQQNHDAEPSGEQEVEITDTGADVAD
ncbi:MAG: PBP1A family penicillin-binding protein [Clostridia bacterium]|nr:PBP1A family penicillin-binding protein [Clostridia bacterium]